jgi:dihydroflavonol-4-reductase
VSELREQGVELVEGDLLEDAAVRTAAAGCELVFHLAGVVSHERRRLAELQAVNVEGTQQLLSAVEPSARVVHVSSVAALGPVSSPDRRADEDHPFPAAAAELPYAATKRAGELLALEAAAAGLDVVVAEPGFLLGPGDDRGVSTWPVFAYLAGQLRFTTRGGLSFVDVRDVAHGLVLLAERGRAGERTILTSSAGNLSWPAFFDAIAAVSGVHRRTIPLPARLGIAAASLPGAVSRDEARAASRWWFCTPEKAERELGFRARPLDQTIADTIVFGSSPDDARAPSGNARPGPRRRST